MGGWGSGWRGITKLCVEDCLVLSIGDLTRLGMIVPGTIRKGSLSWTNGQTGEVKASLAYEVDVYREVHGSIRLSYETCSQQVHKVIWLRATTPNFGGRRWWFKCPVTGTLVTKLYLPPGKLDFASRKAHDLTYRSCQESGKLRGLDRQLEKFKRHLGLAGNGEAAC